MIAELTAAVLAQLYGKKLNLGGHYHYIADYSEKEGINAYHACLSVLGDVQACLIMIIGEQDGLKKAAYKKNLKKLHQKREALSISEQRLFFREMSEP